MKRTTKVWIVSALVLLMAAMLVAPVAARDGWNEVEDTDTIFWYEKNLDFATNFADAIELVHYTDETVFGSPTNDRVILDTPGDFTLPMTKYEDTYYIRNGTANRGSVTIAKPYVTLDVVNGVTLVDKLNDRTVTKGTPVAFRLRSNVPGGFVGSGEVPYLELRFTSPNTGQTRIFGTRSDDIVAPFDPANYVYTELIQQDFYTTNGASFDFYSVTDDVLSGVWQVRAQWVAPAAAGCAAGFCDFYGEGVDSNTVSFTMGAGQVVLSANKDEVIRENPFAITITGRGNQQYWLYIEDEALNCNEYPYILEGQPGIRQADYDNRYDENWVFDDIDDDIIFEDFECKDGAGGDVEDSLGTDVFKAVVTTTAAGTRTVEFGTNE